MSEERPAPANGAAEQAPAPKPKTPRKRAAKGASASKRAKAHVPATPDIVVAPPKASAAPAETPKHPAPAAAKPATLSEAIMSQSADSLSQLSRNLAEAMTRANAVFSTALIDQTRSHNLPTNADPFNVTSAMNAVWTSLATHPETIRDAHFALWQTYFDIWTRYTASTLTGSPVTQEDSRDKRFRDPEWRTNPHFALMRETYMATSNFLTSLIEKSDADVADKRKAGFFIKQAIDAASPSNFLMTNPTALRALIETHGESLLKGIDNLSEDLKRGHGMLAIKQTDMDAFKLGENIATTPGKVVWRNKLFELIQYTPTTEKVLKAPLLIVPPWINKFYIMDLQPKNSMIRWLLAQGHSVFLVSWINPDVELAEATFEDYMRDGIYAAVDAVEQATGEHKMNAVGYCIGGTLLAATLAHMSHKGDERIQSATYFASQSDFELAGDLTVFIDDAGIKYLEGRIDQHGGFLDAQAMADTFNALRSNDLIWNYVVDNYYLGTTPAPFDLLFWNSDQTRMPKALHLFYLRNFYRDNLFAKGEMTLLGEAIHLSDVKTPSYMQAAREDHIAPAPSVYRTAKLFGGPVTYMMSGSGHIAGVINPPAAKRYQHWVNESLPNTFEEWRAGATEIPGSWWENWDAWLRKRSGPEVPARMPGDGPLKPITDAPGDYVRIRSEELDAS